MTFILEEKEAVVLARLAGPMVTALLGVIVFNLVDTFFVGRLGSLELAALSFTFPVVMVIGSIAHGLGVGITAAVSRAVGERNRKKQVGLITWGIVLALLVVSFFATAGFFTIEALFTLLGADGETLEVIKVYMRIWYPGVLFMVVPMAGSAAIRGLGDTKTPSGIILAAALLNTLLDPLLIFGIGPFPELGVAGAALATVIARGATFLAVMYVLIYREKVICVRPGKASDMFDAWKDILFVGIPNILTKLMAPVASGIITGMVAVYGSNAVAGFGIASRLEMLAMVMISSLVSIIPVFVGQNRGAGHIGRILRGLKLSNNFCLIYGAFIWLLLLAIAEPVVKLINDEPEIVDVAVTYLMIVPLAYGLQGMMQLAATTLNVLKRPVHSAGITLVQLFVVYIPFAWMASRCFGIIGIFGSLAFSYAITGAVGSRLNLKYIHEAAV